MEPAHTLDAAARWRRFALNETPKHSAVMYAWALGASEDAEVMALVEQLPARERQPNLVLAAARAVDPSLIDADYPRLREVLLTRWSEVSAITATHHTQTNEAARLAVMLPALAELHRRTGRELALIELGASAGLALHPDLWRFRYADRAGRVLSEFGPTDRPVLEVTVKGDVALPERLPPIAWRLGVDLNPLNPLNQQDAEWLRTLVWPGQDDRLERLEAALEVARVDPVLVLARDITHPDMLDEVLALVPTDYLPVVCHGAVMAYLDTDDRAALDQRLMGRVRAGGLHWLSNEGQLVVPTVAAALGARPEFASALRKGAFIVALDGVPHYQADGHAAWIL